jgi:protein-disulfide isomerase
MSEPVAPHGGEPRPAAPSEGGGGAVQWGVPAPYAWYRQAGAWVVIGALAVAFAVAVTVLVLRPVAGAPAGPAPTGGTESAAASDESPGATDADATEFPAVPKTECPAVEGTPGAPAGEPAGGLPDFGISLGCDAVPGGPASGATIRVDVMSDYICPYCQRFEQEVGEQLEQALKDGQIQLVVHPMGYLDGFSTTDYSSRAARAATAVAGLDPEHFMAFDQALWDNQPAEGGPGLTDEEIAGLARGAGVAEDAIAQFTAGGYDEWVASSTQLVTNTQGFSGTPWVVIGDGETSYPWDWSQGDLQLAIARVAAGQQP